MRKKEPYHILIFLLLALLLGCKSSPKKLTNRNNYGLPNYPDFCAPKVYQVETLKKLPNIDGLLKKGEWDAIAWSESLVSELKDGVSDATYSCKYKLATSKDSLYFSAIISDQHIWAINDICQSYFFDDNFLELYIDDDNDELDYTVIKINALGNLCGEYRHTNMDKPLFRFSLLDDANAKCSVQIEGTLNKPTDLDEYWSVECAIPLNLKIDSLVLLKPNNEWNVNVQRSYWPSTIVSGLYKKMLNPDTGKKYPSEKWVWSFLNENSIYMPELWGEWHFSAQEQNGTQYNLLQKHRLIKWELRNVFYAQQIHLKKHNRYARKVAGLKDIGLILSKLQFKPKINAQKNKFEAIIVDNETKRKFVINEKGKVWEE